MAANTASLTCWPEAAILPSESTDELRIRASLSCVVFTRTSMASTACKLPQILYGQALDESAIVINQLDQ